MYLFFLFLVLGVFTSPLMAGYPEPWQMTFQKAASPMMEGIVEMHNLLLVIITAIAFFVIALLGYVIYKFRAAKNPIPSKTSHHVVLEVILTLIPVITLTVIGVPSLKLLFKLDSISSKII